MKLRRNYVLDITSKDSRVLSTFVNPHSYYLLQDAKLHNSFDYIYADGLLVCLMELFFSFRLVRRKSFDYTSIAPEVFEYCNQMNFNVLIVGSTDDCLDQFIFLLKKHYPKINFYYRNGFFSSEEEINAYLKSINDVFFHVVVAGMGTPAQEKFVIKCKEILNFNQAFTCGGFITQTTNTLNYYPRIINFLKLRVPYRFVFEEHVRKRYITTYPKFLIRYIFDKMSKRKNR